MFKEIITVRGDLNHINKSTKKIFGVIFYFFDIEYFLDDCSSSITVISPEHFSLGQKRFFKKTLKGYLKRVATEFEEEDISHDPGGSCFNNCDTCRKCGNV